MSAGDPAGRPAPRKPWWTPRRMALAGIGIEILAAGRTVFEIFRLRDADGNFPAGVNFEGWVGAAIFAALCALLSAGLLLSGRERPSIAVAVGCVVILMVLRYTALQ